MPDDPHRFGGLGEGGRVDPDSLTQGDGDNAFARGRSSPDVVLRALSVVPFLLVAAMGLIALVSWVLIVVFGIGTAEPIWRSLQGLSVITVLRQLALALLMGLAPVLTTLGASWAAAHGFRETAGRPFWTTIEGLWGLAAVLLVYVDRAREAWLDDLGVSGLDWWFAFGVVAFAMILAGIRLRRAPRTDGEDGA